MKDKHLLPDAADKYGQIEFVALLGRKYEAFINKKTRSKAGFTSLVPRTGFEPAHLAALPPEDSASTNFAIWAFDNGQQR